MSHDDIVASLSRTDAFAEDPGPVETRETHISVVFLTPRFAWKLLKPVRFEFLDFSTREARYVECWNELRLNRRLAPDVYLDVVPVVAEFARIQPASRDPCGIRSEAPLPVASSSHVGILANSATDDTPLDWLLKMRRLPDEATLTARIAAGEADAGDIDHILDVLCPFFDRAPTNREVAAHGRPDVVRRNVLENLTTLESVDGGKDRSAASTPSLTTNLSVAVLKSAQLQFLATREALFRSRIEAGRIREGHGDLKAEHCYLLEGSDELRVTSEEDSGPRHSSLVTRRLTRHPSRLVIVDCIAFNRRFRCLDTLDEVCFLAVDLKRLGRADLAEHLHAEYRRRTGDSAPAELAAFYESYRFTVRAKVACLKTASSSGQERNRLWRQAAEFVENAIAAIAPHHRPRLVVVFGLSGTGKSTIARGLAERIGAVHLASDVVRKELHGLDPLTRGEADKLYSQQANEQTYSALRDEARRMSRAGASVILDATFRRRADREEVATLAKEFGAEPLFVECRCAAEVARRRIAKRMQAGSNPSDADVGVYESQRCRYEPPDEIDAADLLRLDTEQPVDESIRQIVSRLAVV